MIKKRLYAYILLLVLALLSLPIGSQAQSGDQVYVIDLKNEITPAMSAYLIDQIEIATLAKAEGVIIDISTLGGRVDSAEDMRDAILAAEIPIVVFVGTRAISAGALITIAADTIIMAPGSHMGAAEPIPYSEKAVAYVSGEFRSTAEVKGRDPLIAAGMADKDLEVPGFPKGKLVNLTASEATNLSYADGVLHNITEVLEFMGWEKLQVVEVQPNARVRIAQFLTRYEVASILLTIALIAMVIEILVQGFGLPGMISIIAFALYFGGGFLAGNTEWWSALLFALGLILLLIEVFVPGFGIIGVAGIVSLAIGIIFAAPTPMEGLLTLTIALAATAILVPILYKLLGGPKLFRRLVLQESETVEKGYVSKADDALTGIVGMSGEAITPLRPSGTILIDGKRLDAISDGGYLPAGAIIKVIETQGARIIVTAEE